MLLFIAIVVFIVTSILLVAKWSEQNRDYRAVHWDEIQETKRKQREYIAARKAGYEEAKRLKREFRRTEKERKKVMMQNEIARRRAVRKSYRK